MSKRIAKLLTAATVCLLLTGTNDFIGGKSAEQAFDNIKRIMAKAAQLESMQMILLTPLLTYRPFRNHSAGAHAAPRTYPKPYAGAGAGGGNGGSQQRIR